MKSSAFQICKPNDRISQNEQMFDEQSLREITSSSHDLLLDLRYGTVNNFTSQRIYQVSKCLLHPDALIRLELAVKLAGEQNLRLKVFDAFRPQKAQEKLWEICPNDNFVANPVKGSLHTRGIAVDVTLVGKDGKELDMGTEFDDFTELAYHGSTLISPSAARNRYLLLGIMISAGFQYYALEWWHYQLPNADTYQRVEHDYEMM